MAIIDVVKWDPAPGVFAWKHPNGELHTKTQLIVSESQEAYLFSSGQAIGPFGPGKHVLDTANYPVLTSIIKCFTGGNTPYPAEVWFISKSFKLDVKWGTSAPIQLEDPKYHIMIPVRAFGQYGLAVEDTSRFLLKMIGMVPAFTEKTLMGYFKGIIDTKCKDAIATYLVKNSVSFLQIAAYLEEISEAVQSYIASEMLNYGLRLVNFTINSITADEHDPAVSRLRQALATRAEMDIVGYNYQQKRSYDVVETAAGNPGNGDIMNAGMGMAMGMGMGMPMGNTMGGMFSNMVNNVQNPQNMFNCPGCNKPVAENSDFCSWCGKNLRMPDTVPCPHCGQSIAAGSVFCMACGQRLNKVCAGCGKTLQPGTAFCPECGKKVE